MKTIILTLGLLAITAQAQDRRLNYAKWASDAITLAEDRAIEDKNCALTSNSFQTVFHHPKLKRFGYEHIAYKNGFPYAGFRHQGNVLSYHQAVSGQWQYRVKVNPGREVRFQKFLNRGSKVVVSGNQSVAKMNDYLHGAVRVYRVFCAVKERDSLDGFGKPKSTRYTDVLIQTPDVLKAKTALQECVDYWFVQPLTNDLCK